MPKNGKGGSRATIQLAAATSSLVNPAFESPNTIEKRGPRPEGREKRTMMPNNLYVRIVDDVVEGLTERKKGRAASDHKSDISRTSAILNTTGFHRAID